MALTGMKLASTSMFSRKITLPFGNIVQPKSHSIPMLGGVRRITSAQPSRHYAISLSTSHRTLLRHSLPLRLSLYGHPCYAPFSTSVAKPSTVSSQKSQQTLKWRIIARIAFYLRIPFLVLSVYGIGYQQGIMDYSREPEKMESKLLDTTLASVGCTSAEDKEKVLIAREGEWRNMLAKFHGGGGSDDETHHRMVMMHNVSIVGEKIVKVAQSHVKQQLMEAVREATGRMPPEVLENESLLYKALEMNEEVDTWTKARRHMEGPWRFVLIPSPVPNAFVSEILPHRIFITTSMFEAFVETQDELALILGHEISHLILGHSSAQNSLETSFRTLEILLLSLDPSEGLLSLAFMSFLASIRSAIGAVHSREHERCADELGIKLTAMACFDTHAASKVFYKMHKHNVESGMESSSTRVGWGGLLSFFSYQYNCFTYF